MDKDKYELITTATGAQIKPPTENIDPTAGTRAGTAWRLVKYVLTPNGATQWVDPIDSAPVRTVLADQVRYTVTRREKTPAEIDSAKAETVSHELGITPAGRALKQAFEALFYLAKQDTPGLTLAQFKTAVDGLNAIPDQAFYDWIKAKL